MKATNSKLEVAIIMIIERVISGFDQYKTARARLPIRDEVQIPISRNLKDAGQLSHGTHKFHTSFPSSMKLNETCVFLLWPGNFLGTVQGVLLLGGVPLIGILRYLDFGTD